MKRRVQSAFLLLTVFLLTGCVDFFQYVSLRNGNVDFTLRYTVQKMIFEMGASFSGEEVDYDEVLGIGDEVLEGFKDLSGEMRKIENELEVGGEITVNGSVDTLLENTEGYLPFIPQKKDSGYEIIIPGFGSETDDADDEMAYAFLASAKYRLLVDLRDDLEGMENVQIIAQGRELKDEGMFSAKVYGTTLLIEFPAVFLFMSENDLVVRLTPKGMRW